MWLSKLIPIKLLAFPSASVENSGGGESWNSFEEFNFHLDSMGFWWIYKDRHGDMRKEPNFPCDKLSRLRFPPSHLPQATPE